jgi:hypothetical protein
MVDIVNTALNLIGLGLQIEGVLIIAYAVRKIVFPKIRIFHSTLDSPTTVSDNTPVDEETNKKVEEVTVIDPRKTKFGVISIVAGLAFQFLAISICPCT